MPALNYMHPDGSLSPFDHLLPEATLSVDESMMDLFFSTMQERHSIYFRRNDEGMKFPWTEDEIMRDFKFTNVYRELDKNSKWEILNILLDDRLSDEDILFQILIFRAFNEPRFFEYCKKEYPYWRNGIPTFEDYKRDDIKTYFASLIENYRATGNNPFTNSYVINSKSCPGKTRDWCYGNTIIPEIHKRVPRLLSFFRYTCNSAYSAACSLKALPGAGWFVAHEYYVSLTYIKKYRTSSFFHWTEDDWTNVGPGASLGIRLIFPNLKTTADQKQAITWLRDISKSKLVNFKYLVHKKEYNHMFHIWTDDGKLTLHQIEFWLCEFGKYWKMSVGEGKTRQKYIPKQ